MNKFRTENKELFTREIRTKDTTIVMHIQCYVNAYIRHFLLSKNQNIKHEKAKHVVTKLSQVKKCFFLCYICVYFSRKKKEKKRSWNHLEN